MPENAYSIKGNLFKNIFVMSRPPFHIVGVLPFVLGTVLAYKITGAFSLPVFLLSAFAVILIMLLTYYNGEYYDIKEDALAAKLGKNVFSGGSQIIAQNMLPRKFARIGSIISLLLAIVIGLLLQFYFKTGILTIPLGAVGIFLGFFYLNPPFRWVSRGVGELFIGFCYGWLAVAAGFYLQTQEFNQLANWASIPIALTIFNVILINEYPDYDADFQSGKRNIVVRFGREKSIIIYTLSAVLTWLFFGLSILFGIPIITVYFYIPFFLISVFIIFSLVKRTYYHKKKLEMLCGLTIFINIGVTLSYILGAAIAL